MNRTLLLSLLTVTILGCVHSAVQTPVSPPAPIPREAFYVSQSGQEGNEPWAVVMRLSVTGTEEIDGRDFVWWEFAVENRQNVPFGVRVLSERAPMSPAAGINGDGTLAEYGRVAGNIGEVARYLYHTADGVTLDYRDDQTGRAVLPPVQFLTDFLPVASRNAHYADGFASAGTYLGHSLIRLSAPRTNPERLDFSNPRVLNLRPNVLVASQISQRHIKEDILPTESPGEARPYTRAEIEELIDAGVNLFGDVGELMPWLKDQPVFWMGFASFPHDFYRANYYSGRWYMDEPAVRFGWDPTVPDKNLLGPEQMAEALSQRVRQGMKLEDRLLNIGWHTGALEVIAPRPNVWDTYYETAWYQIGAGARAIFHEGRYKIRGYGWSPEAFFDNEGLAELTFEDQMNYLNSYMRGAARAFDADWGMSVYPEGLPELYIPAFLHSYDMGARYFQFWTHPPQVTYDVHVKTARALLEHRARHPRDIDAANRQATHALVLPPGYTITPNGSVWGFDPNRLTRAGVTYGEVAAAVMSEAILLSRRGISYDIIIDDPGVDIDSLGYDQLIAVHPDATLSAKPPRREDRAPGPLSLALVESASPTVQERVAETAGYTAHRLDSVTIDGNIGHNEWPDNWLTLGSEALGSDLIELNLSLPNIASATLWEEHHVNYLGFEWDALDERLQERFDMEDYHIVGPDVVDPNRPGISLEQGAVIVTSVTPGMAADQAGLRPGDVIRYIGNKDIEWTFEVWGFMERGRGGNPSTFELQITRNEKARVGYEGDLSGRFQMGLDEDNLYVAALITDDTQSQPFHGWYLWAGDCLQLGFAPTFSNTDGGYSNDDTELGFALLDNANAVAYRYNGRRGMPREYMDIPVAVRRDGNTTIYEAAVPIAELAPFAPDLWGKAAFNIVVNDHDGGDESQRKGRLELVEGAMTRSKTTSEFEVVEFEPTPDTDKLSAALFWHRRATPQDEGLFRLKLAARAGQPGDYTVRTVLAGLDTPSAAPVVETLTHPAGTLPEERFLEIRTISPPGRYALDVTVLDPEGREVARDRLPVLVYPGTD